MKKYINIPFTQNEWSVVQDAVHAVIDSMEYDQEDKIYTDGGNFIYNLTPNEMKNLLRAYRILVFPPYNRYKEVNTKINQAIQKAEK